MSASCPDVMTADGPLKCVKDVMTEGKDDLARFSITGSNNQTPISCEVAVAFDAMTETEVKEEIEQSTHIMVAGFLRELKNATNVTYEKVESLLTQGLVVKPDTGYEVVKADRYSKTGDKSKFLVDGKPSPAIQRDIKSWLTRAINNKIVMDDLNLDTTFLGRVITSASQCIDWLSSLLSPETTYKEKTIIDLGVLRFPDELNEHFLMYKVELKAYIDASREIHEMVDKNGLFVTFESKRYVPRETTISLLTPETKAKAAAESVALYVSKPKTKTAVPKRNEVAWPAVCTASGKLPTVIEVLKNAKSALESFDMKTDGPVPLEAGLAVAFDDLTAPNIKNMGEFTLVTVAGVNRKLKKLDGPFSYETVKSILSDMSILAPTGAVIRSEVISKTYVGGKFPDAATHDDVRREITLWFKKLLSDSEILEDLQGLLDMNTMVNCLVTAGKHLGFLGKVKGEHEYNSRGLVDLTVLRFPDDTREYFHLYKIELMAFTDCTREMIDEQDKCGIKGDFQAVKFGPRTSVLEGLSRSIIDRISNEALTFYGAKM